MIDSLNTLVPDHPRMYVAGAWRDSSDGSTLVTVDPSTEQEIARIPDATEGDVDDAVTAGHEAFRAWRDLAPRDRADRLYTLADLIEKDAERLARIDTVESGNPIGASMQDVLSAARDVRGFAGLAGEMKGPSVANGSGQFAYSRLEPYGVVGRIVAYNHPLKYAASKVAAILLAGNAVVLKPSEHTSLSALRLAELAHDLLPAGLLNVVTGAGARAGAAISAHPGIPRVAFTGGLEAGRAVLRAGADSIKHVTMELGGKNPLIVFPDVSPAKAAEAAVKGMNFARSQGQSCQSTSRVFVHDSIHDAFVEELVARASQLTIGDPLDPANAMGPLAYRSHFTKVQEYIRTGSEQGARLLLGGEPLQRRGYFVPPTVFVDVEHGMTIASEEIFGPVVSVLRWNDVDTVISAANDISYGLTANVWTADLRNAHRTAHQLEAGYVWVNGSGSRVPGTSFGGFKQSGLGKESSIEELFSYVQEKVVAVGLVDVDE